MTLRFHHQLSLLWLALILAMNVQGGLSASLRHQSPQESDNSHQTTSDNQEQVTSENGEGMRTKVSATSHSIYPVA